MSDQPERKQINFTIVPDEQPGEPRTYANFCSIAHTPFDFTLTFCEVMPLSEQQLRAAEKEQVVKAPVRTRVVVPVQFVPNLIAALQEHMRVYSESYTNVGWAKTGALVQCPMLRAEGSGRNRIGHEVRGQPRVASSMRWPSCTPAPRPNSTSGRRSSCSSPRCCRRSPPTRASTWSRRRCSRAIPDAAALAGAAAPELEAIIVSTGFFRQKAKASSRWLRLLVEHHGGQVPADMDALTALPGVGRKTANVVLGHALGVPGLPVDRHVLRVANRIGLAEGDDPVEVESQLCAPPAARPLDAGVGRADPARPPRLQTEAAVRPVSAAARLPLLSDRRGGRAGAKGRAAADADAARAPQESS